MYNMDIHNLNNVDENPYTEQLKSYHADVRDGRGYMNTHIDPEKLKQKEAEWNAIKNEIAQRNPNDPYAVGEGSSALLRSLFGGPKGGRRGSKYRKSKRTRRR